jgi:hypothetical protein
MKYQSLTTVMVTVLPSAASTFVLKTKNNHKLTPMLNGHHYENTNININEDFALPLRSTYQKDIDALNEILESKGAHQLDQIKHLNMDIQQTRQNYPEVALPQKLRDALADYRNAEAKYGADSREAKIAYTYLSDISIAKGLKPERYLGYDTASSDALNEGLSAVTALEELKDENAHGDKCKCHWNQRRCI